MKEKLNQILKNPDRRYGVYPIIHHNVLKDELIDQMDQDGFAGVVANIEYRRHFDIEDTVWKETAANIRECAKSWHPRIYAHRTYPRCPAWTGPYPLH